MQGSQLIRDGKRGTVVAFPDGTRWTVPYGSSDHKARDAMRAVVRRHGLTWPLDGEPPTKKEPMIAQLDRPLLAHKTVPAALASADPAWLPREEQYRRIEPFLRGQAGTPFWTDTLMEKIRAAGIPGWASNASNQRLMLMLGYANFKVIEAKPNRNGKSYRWDRDEREPWPDTFASPLVGAALRRHQARQQADSADAPDQEVIRSAPTPLDLNAVRARQHVVLTTEEATTELNTPVTDAPEEQPVPQGNSDEDAALDLATEYEQRALRLERELAAAKDAFKADIAGANARANRLLRRQAELEGMIHQRDVLIAQVTSERDELKHALAESSGSAENMDALIIEREANTALRAQLKRSEREIQEARSELLHRPTVNDQDGWWDLEGAQSQTVQQLLEGAQAFGLDVRIQARKA